MRGEHGADDDIAIGELRRTATQVSFLVRNQTQLDEARERMFRETRGAAMTGQRDWNVNTVDTTRIVMTPTRAGQQHGGSRPLAPAIGRAAGREKGGQ